MKAVEFHQWFVPSTIRPGKMVRSRWKMSAKDAADYEGATIVPGTMEIRHMAETPEEHAMLLYRLKEVPPPRDSET